MEHTENYHLPQWEETDRIMRTDFNEAMESIENGLTDAAKVTYAAGYYLGWGEERKIVTGFRPRMLMIHGVRQTTQSQEEVVSAFFLNAPSSHILTYTDDGFILHAPSTLYYPKVNTDGRSYAYVAFR